ncbi:MAG: response regulator, partial [Desulfobacteraceae bacterium]
TRRLIGIDQPFEYEEVAAVTGPEYVMNLHHDGVVFLPYESLKERAFKTSSEDKQRKTVLVKRPEDKTAKGVLVIDDEAAVNNNIRKILTKKGYQVDQALTKEEAFESLRQKEYSLVLLDLKMPGVKGLELLKAIRDLRPGAMVVIITGYASIEAAVESARMGAVDFLAKPFTPAEIRQAAENALSLAA